MFSRLKQPDADPARQFLPLSALRTRLLLTYVRRYLNLPLSSGGGQLDATTRSLIACSAVPGICLYNHPTRTDGAQILQWLNELEQ